MIFVNNLDPVLFELGPIAVRWYGLMFASGLALTYFFTMWVFRREKLPVSHLDSLAVYLFSGLVVGARLGHFLFYNPGVFMDDPIEIFRIWNGGLASHGAAIGVLIAYLIWIKRRGVKFSKYADALVLGFPIIAGFVRIGNFINSEIVGVRSGVNFGVVFERLGEGFARHPVQLYEGGLLFLVFGIMFLVYKNRGKRTPPLFFLFLFMLLYFAGRFIVEFWKARHVVPADFPLSMGQMLSIVPVGLAIFYFAGLSRKRRH